MNGSRLFCLRLLLLSPPPHFLLVCSPTHPSFRSYLFCQVSYRKTGLELLAPRLRPSSPPPFGLYARFFSCAVLLFLCFPGRRSSYSLYFILLGCLIPSPHPQPPNIPQQLKAGKLSIASRGRLSLCENPQVASLAGFP